MGLVMLWSKMGKPPLSGAIHKYVYRKEYKEELMTNKMVERYNTVFRFCELYQSWALEKKLQQSEDITRQENFEINPDLPLNIIH